MSRSSGLTRTVRGAVQRCLEEKTASGPWGGEGQEVVVNAAARKVILAPGPEEPRPRPLSSHQKTR